MFNKGLTDLPPESPLKMTFFRVLYKAVFVDWSGQETLFRCDNTTSPPPPPAFQRVALTYTGLLTAVSLNR